MARRIDELVTERSKDPVVGCNDESRLLSGPLEPDGRIVALVHGIAGIGKTTLVRAFAERARLTGAWVVEIDGANIEPTTAGVEARWRRQRASTVTQCRQRSRPGHSDWLHRRDRHERAFAVAPVRYVVESGVRFLIAEGARFVILGVTIAVRVGGSGRQGAGHRGDDLDGFPEVLGNCADVR